MSALSVILLAIQLVNPLAYSSVTDVKDPENPALISHHVTLSWVASTTPNVDYKIYSGAKRPICALLRNKSPVATGITAFTWTDPKLVKEGTMRFYAVTAYNRDGESTCLGDLRVYCPVSTSPKCTTIIVKD